MRCLERGNMHQSPNAVYATSVNDFPRQFRVDAPKIALRLLMQDSGQVDYGLATGNQSAENFRVVDVRLDDLGVGQDDQFALDALPASGRDA